MASTETRLSAVVSPCCKKDLATWRRVAPALLEHIACEAYVVVVPDQEVADFVATTPAAFRVEPESAYVGDAKWKLLNFLPPDNRWRAGWYLQQFVKLAAAKAAAGDFVLIWDSDTLPLKRLSFVDDSGQVVFYRGSEHHKPYFETLERLLGFGKCVDFSFIAQCLPARPAWVRALCADIEARHGCAWIDAIIRVLDPAKHIGFSEYETLGNYMIRHFPNGAVACDRPWLRTGGALFPNVSKVSDADLDALSQQYDYVSFEK